MLHVFAAQLYRGSHITSPAHTSGAGSARLPPPHSRTHPGTRSGARNPHGGPGVCQARCAQQAQTLHQAGSLPLPQLDRGGAPGGEEEGLAPAQAEVLSTGDHPPQRCAPPAPGGNQAAEQLAGPQTTQRVGWCLLLRRVSLCTVYSERFLLLQHCKPTLEIQAASELGKRAAAGNCRVPRARGSSFGTSGRAAKGRAQQAGERSHGKQWHFNLFRARGG